MLYVGSGAVNLCLAAWMHDAIESTEFLVRTQDNPIISTRKFVCKLPQDADAKSYDCKAFATLDGVDCPDLVVVGVKNYSLDNVLDKIEQAFGKDLPVMSVLNGVTHVTKISERLSNSIFATIIFNAYRKSPNEAVAVGNAVGLSAFNRNNDAFEKLQQLLQSKLNLSLVENPFDAAHCKLVINLGNALLTIVGFHENRNRELDVLQKLTSTVMNEGVTVLKKNGVREAKISGMPSWFLIRISKTLPQWITLPIFKKKLEGNSINSMAQDVSVGSDLTELEDINGYFLQLADKVGEEVPYNRALYHIFKKWSSNNGQSLPPSELLAGINSFSKR